MSDLITHGWVSLKMSSPPFLAAYRALTCVQNEVAQLPLAVDVWAYQDMSTGLDGHRLVNCKPCWTDA